MPAKIDGLANKSYTYVRAHLTQYPNVAGFLVSCIQVALYFWYRKPQNKDHDGAPPPQNGGVPPGAQWGEIVELAAV